MAQGARALVSVRFAGDSGDGIQLLGERFTQEAAKSGSALATRPDYPAEIRAPAGTLGGVSAFQICFGSDEVRTSGDDLDVLVAFNPAALKGNLNDVKPGGLVLCNSDTFVPKNLSLAGFESNPLEDGALGQRVRLQPIPMQRMLSETLKDSGLAPNEMKRCANFFALGVVSWLFSLPIADSVTWIEKKFGKKKEIAAANLAALNAGMSYAESREIITESWQVQKASLTPGRYRSVSGHQGVVFGLLAGAQSAGKDFFFAGYPITPASEVMQELSRIRAKGVVTLQVEDEIASLGAVIGAAFAGDVAATATSGPGMSLMSELLGLGVIAELPLVVVNVQRAGPATGMPTKTEQADLSQALFGRHGECPLAVLAIASPADAFDCTFEAVRIAVEHMTPVILLSDGYVANGAEPWRIPDLETLPRIIAPQAPALDGKSYQPYLRVNESLARPWVSPGTAGYEHRIGGLEKAGASGAVTYDPILHEQMVKLRADKVARIAKSYAPLKISGPESGETLVVGWGSSAGAIETATRTLRERGLSISHVHLRNLAPLPNDLGAVLARFKRIIVPELNAGQFVHVLRSAYPQSFLPLNKVQGQTFRVSEIISGIESLLAANEQEARV